MKNTNYAAINQQTWQHY